MSAGCGSFNMHEKNDFTANFAWKKRLETIGKFVRLILQVLVKRIIFDRSSIHVPWDLKAHYARFWSNIVLNTIKNRPSRGLRCGGTSFGVRSTWYLLWWPFSTKILSAPVWRGGLYVHLEERCHVFLFVFTGVGGVLRFPWHLVRGMDRCRCGKSSRVFRCCLVLFPLLSFQTVVIYEDFTVPVWV